MQTVYAVQTIAVRDEMGAVVGWVRADLLADGSSPKDLVFLRDGSASGQAEAMLRIAHDPGLLYSSEDEAARDGLARLREAHARGWLQPLGRRQARRRAARATARGNGAAR